MVKIERYGVLTINPQTTQKDLEEQLLELDKYYTNLAVQNEENYKNALKKSPSKYTSVDQILKMRDRGVDTVLDELNKTTAEVLGKTYTRDEYLEMNLEDLKTSLEIFLDIPTVPTTLINQPKPKQYIENAKKCMKRRQDDFIIIITAPNEFDLKTIEKYKNLLKSFKGKKVNVIISSQLDIHSKNINSPVEYVFSSHEINSLIDLNNFLLENEYEPLRFQEFENVTHTNLEECWTIDLVIKSNNYINKTVEFIKENHLSPFEATLYIHKKITEDFPYKVSKEDFMKSQTILGAFTEEKCIVCAGQASLQKAIIDKLNMEGLSCKFANCRICDDKFLYIGSHVHGQINIKDPKYKIDGSFFDDVCWDSSRKFFDDGAGFANCLYPICDALNLRCSLYIQENPTNRYDQLVCQADNLIKSLKEKPTNTPQENFFDFLMTSKKLKPKTKKISIKTFELGLQKLKEIVPTINVKRELAKSMFSASIGFTTSSKTDFTKATKEELKQIVSFVSPKNPKSKKVERFI